MKLKPTEESLSAKKFVEDSGKMMANLAERWLDEHKYEDPKDYQKVIQDFADKMNVGLKIESMIRRPFGCLFTVDERQYRYTVIFKGNRVITQYQRIV